MGRACRAGQGYGNGPGLATEREKQAGGGVEDDLAPEVGEVVANGL
jgi:hypothetical protein